MTATETLKPRRRVPCAGLAAIANTMNPASPVFVQAAKLCHFS
jgi:hypothetical protein